MITEPGLNMDGRNLLYRARLHIRQNGGAYPLARDSDIRGALVAVPGGYIRRADDDPHLVTMTEKGHAYLDCLMRCV